jgi:hypothetical protein
MKKGVEKTSFSKRLLGGILGYDVPTRKTGARVLRSTVTSDLQTRSTIGLE